MRNNIALSVLILLITLSLAFAQKAKDESTAPELIAAYGTSYSPESFNAVDLLNPKSKGYWQPQSQDFGVNEGIYFQFLEPIFINFIEVVVEGDVADKLTLQPYLNGQTQIREAKTAIREVFSGMFEDKNGESGWYLYVLKDENGNYYHPYDNKRLSAVGPWRGVFKDETGKIYNDGTVIKDKDGNYIVYGNEWLRLSVDGNEPPVLDLGVFEEPYYAEGYKITASAKLEKRNTVFTINQNKTDNLEYATKSIFLKITDAKILPKIKSIKIFGKDKNTPLVVNIPLTPKAVVTASSVLTPAIAYSPKNLFDSQLDMAWSTNGKETDGINQSVTVTFDSKEEIGGIIIWNGYQRSDAHFKANGRVKKLDINGQIAQAADTQGLQTILLPNKIKTDKITLTIKEIFKGKKYKDVLISELRFITPEGRIILPQVKRAFAELSKNDVFKTDVTYINLIASFEYDNGPDSEPEDVPKDTLRIRNNGSFVLYRESKYENADISEGNWEETGKNKIRVFGKKYRIQPSVTSIYTYVGYNSQVDDPNVKPTDIVIFQSDVTLSKFNSLTKKEQENIVRFILRATKYFCLPDAVYIRAKIQKDRFSFSEYREDGAEAMLEDMIAEFEKINPIYIKSDVYTGLMIPNDEAK